MIAFRPITIDDRDWMSENSGKMTDRAVNTALQITLSGL